MYSLENISNDPLFNFSESLLSNDFLISNNSGDQIDDSPYNNLDISCKYLDESTFCNTYSNNQNFTFLSLNVQSLQAKFGELQELISNTSRHNCAPDIILLQELWQIYDAPSLSLPNYSPLKFKTRSDGVQGGGVGIYFKKHLSYNILEEKSIFVDRVIETIFAEVQTCNNNKIIIASIYRPCVNHPTLSSLEQFHYFIDMFTNILNSYTEQKTPVYIFGDFNLDALKYNINNKVTEYIDHLFSHGFIQIVMRPTRCTPTTATLIDHVITNSRSTVFETIILVSQISDHFPILFFSKEPK